MNVYSLQKPKPFDKTLVRHNAATKSPALYILVVRFFFTTNVVEGFTDVCISAPITSLTPQKGQAKLNRIQTGRKRQKPEEWSVRGPLLPLPPSSSYACTFYQRVNGSNSVTEGLKKYKPNVFEILRQFKTHFGFHGVLNHSLSLSTSRGKSTVCVSLCIPL